MIARVFKAAEGRTRRSIPYGLLGMIALAGAIECLIAAHQRDFADPVSYGWLFSAQAATREANRCEILCMGDSLVKHGLLPAVLESESGLSAYNLAAAAAPAPTTYFLLRRAFEAGARPKAIILDWKPSLLAGGPRYRIRQWQELLTPRETLELARSSRSLDLTTEVALGQLLPSLRARHTLRESLMNVLDAHPVASRELNAVLERNWSINAGTNLAAANTGFMGTVSEAQHRDMLSDRFSVHRVNATYARATLALAEMYGARTYVIIPPFTAEILERREQSGVASKFTEFLRSLQHDFPRLTVIDAGQANYPSSAFVDPSHLNRDGTLALSRAVGILLRDDSSREPIPSETNRWLSLTKYTPFDDPTPREDVEQSKARIAAEATQGKGARIR